MPNTVTDQDVRRLLTWLIAATRRGEVAWEEVFHDQYGLATGAGSILLANSNADGEDPEVRARLTLTLMAPKSSICRQVGAPFSTSTPSTPEELLAAGQPQELLELIDDLYGAIRSEVQPVSDEFDVDAFMASL